MDWTGCLPGDDTRFLSACLVIGVLQVRVLVAVRCGGAALPWRLAGPAERRV